MQGLLGIRRMKLEGNDAIDLFFFFFLRLARIKPNHSVMTEGYLYEFWRNTEKPEKLLYLTQASRTKTPGCF